MKSLTVLVFLLKVLYLSDILQKNVERTINLKICSYSVEITTRK